MSKFRSGGTSARKLPLAERFRRSDLFRVFGGKTDGAKGRRCMLASSLLGGFASTLTGGIFYTGFLVGYGISIVDIGIISFLPSIASLFSLLSPYVLERFKKRKLILGLSRMIYYIINILGVTLVPLIVSDNRTRVVLITLIAFFATGFNSMFTQGFSAWHFNFMPDEIRGDYLTLQSCISALVSGVLTLTTSIITDSIGDSQMQLNLIIILRFAALAIAVLDVIALTRPKEYPYASTRDKPRLTDTFTIPLKNRKFALTMVVVVMWNLVACLPNSVINTFLITDVGVSYTLINGVNMTYFFFFLMFAAMWKRFIAKVSWFPALAITGAIQGATFIFYSFITLENHIWLFLVVRHLQHVMGVIVNLCVANLAYINTPETDRTSYFSFYSVVGSMTSVISMMLGTYFVSLFGDNTLVLFGHSFTAVPILIAVSGIGEIVFGAILMLLSPKLAPVPFKLTDKYRIDKDRMKKEKEAMETTAASDTEDNTVGKTDK